MRVRTQKGFARVLTMLLLFFVAVVGVILVFSLFIGILHMGQTSTSKVDVSGALATSTVGGTVGTLMLSVRNLGPASAIGITVSCPATYFASADCGALAFQSNGAPVSKQNLLAQGQTAIGTSTVSAAAGASFAPGRIFTIGYSVSFSDGSVVSGSLQLPAQA